jgi:hypothetical protein
MMHDSMVGMMWDMGLVWLIGVAFLVFAIEALIKYLRVNSLPLMRRWALT